MSLVVSKLKIVRDTFNKEHPLVSPINRNTVVKYLDKMIETAEQTGTTLYRPKVLKRGDMVRYRFSETTHPAILLNKEGDNWRCLLLSSKEIHSIREVSKSRFFTGFYTTFIGRLSEKSAFISYCGRFDNIKEFNSVMKDVRKFYSTI